MKEQIVIKRGSEVLYTGTAINIPIKEENIIERSIEIFGDEDPCVIHQSYVVKELVTDLLDVFDSNHTILLKGSDYLDQLSFINFKNLATITVEIVRKSK